MAAEDLIRVVIVDDHGMVRRGMRSYLSIFDDIEVVGEASNGREALDQLQAVGTSGAGPDVVLVDLAMEPIDGVATTRDDRHTIECVPCGGDEVLSVKRERQATSMLPVYSAIEPS